jgi:four helix bundle protein
MGFNDEFRDRTKKFALRVIKLFQAPPKTEEAKTIGKQLLRSGTSVGANFRAATRARSKSEFYSKLSIADEEADESVFWMELLTESGILPLKKVESLMNEALEISKITSVSRKTFKNKGDKK